MSSRPSIHPIQPSTPPPMYSPSSSPASYSISTSSRYFSPASPPRSEREIIMGGLVSRPTSNRDSDEWDMDEKSSASIEVPGIVLTEPHEDDLPPRSPSPTMKSIMLLPPSSLPIPTDLPVPVTHRNHSSSFMGMLSRRGTPSTAARAIILVGALALGAWHLYVTCDMANLVEDVAEGW